MTPKRSGPNSYFCLGGQINKETSSQQKKNKWNIYALHDVINTNINIKIPYGMMHHLIFVDPHVFKYKKMLEFGHFLNFWSQIYNNQPE